MTDADRNNRDELHHHEPGTTPSNWPVDRDYWRANYVSRPYVSADLGFEFYELAYRYGYESAHRYVGRTWHDMQGDLERGWSEFRDRSRSGWDDVKNAVRDSWDRVMENR